MTVPTAAELVLTRTQPQSTKLWLSVFHPDAVLIAQVNEPIYSGTTQGIRVFNYDNTLVGSYTGTVSGMTILFGSALGVYDLGRVRVRSATATTITVAENSDVQWIDNAWFRIIDFYEIWPVYSRMTQTGTTITFYKDYDIAYTDQNSNVGAFICMGSHYAGFVGCNSNEADIYFTATGTTSIETADMSYHWDFGSSGVTPATYDGQIPGFVKFTGPGYWTVDLSVTVSGSFGINTEVSHRHIALYNRPECGAGGANWPILEWDLLNLDGSRDEAGYTAKMWIRESVSWMVGGALITIFADDQFGDTETTIGGNSPGRTSIVFNGYIVDGSIEYNWRESRYEFDVVSPTIYMKNQEAFSVTVQSCVDPVADCLADPDNCVSSWAMFKHLTIEKGIYHYLKWHSTAMLTNDITFVGTDQKVEYFDADRTSLYDAIQTQIHAGLYGDFVCDRQGKFWVEESFATMTPSWISMYYGTILTVEAGDWMGNLQIQEKEVPELSLLEMGGIAYDGPETETYAAYLASAPGSVPKYQGRVERTQGLALTNQNQLNWLVGSIFAYRNARYPNVIMRMAGGYRIIDIAPQEMVRISIDNDATNRGITWVAKRFHPLSISYDFDPQRKVLLPTITLHELPTGLAGETLSIPVEPPDGGYDQPPSPGPGPIPIPPPPSILIKRFGWSMIINNGSTVIPPGIIGMIEVPFLCTIDSVKLVAQPTPSSIVLDLWRCTYTLISSSAPIHPVVGDSIIGAGAKPTLASEIKSNTVLTLWKTKTLFPGDWLFVNVDSATATLVTLAISGLAFP